MKIANHLIPLVQKFIGRMGYTMKRRRPGIRRSESDQETQVTVEDLMHSLHGEDVFEGFDYQSYPSDVTGWGGDSPAFAELIHEIKPSLIIEVGSWKGASAITMADALAAEKLPGKILCIDTWLGHWNSGRIRVIPNASKLLNVAMDTRLSIFDSLRTSATVGILVGSYHFPCLRPQRPCG